MKFGNEKPAEGLTVPGVLILAAFVGIWAAVAAATTFRADTPQQTSDAAQSLAAKIAQLSAPKPNSRGGLEPVTITETEANSYLQLRGYEFLPPAVKNPMIGIAPDQISAAGDVDFDEMGEFGAKNNDWGARFLALVFKGKQQVVVKGKLETGNGEGKLTIQSLTVGSTSIPSAFVNFLVQDYVERRYRIDLSKPFHLPENVTHIALEQGRATLYRSASPRP